MSCGAEPGSSGGASGGPDDEPRGRQGHGQQSSSIKMNQNAPRLTQECRFTGTWNSGMVEIMGNSG